MIIPDGRGAAAPEDEKVCLDRRGPGGENFLAHRQKGRGLIGGLTPNDNLTRRRRRGWVRLHEKGGKEHEMPIHDNLERYLEEYFRAAGIAEDRKGPLFRTTRGRSGELTENALLQSDVGG